MRALGVDVAGRFGWVGVVVDDRGFCSAHVAGELRALVDEAELALGSARAPGASVAEAGAWPGPADHRRLDVVAIDIPVGLVDGARRSCDVAARRFVGAGRRASVFPAPPLAVIDAVDYLSANATLAQQGLPRLSKQAFALLPGIRQAGALAAEREVIEVFPEATFRLLAGRDLGWYKKTWSGSVQRRELLARAWPPVVPPWDLGPAGVVAVDDLLDAAAVSWSALRYAHGRAEALGDPDESDGVTGRRIAIWV